MWLDVHYIFSTIFYNVKLSKECQTYSPVIRMLASVETQNAFYKFKKIL